MIDSHPLLASEGRLKSFEQESLVQLRFGGRIESPETGIIHRGGPGGQDDRRPSDLQQRSGEIEKKRKRGRCKSAEGGGEASEGRQVQAEWSSTSARRRVSSRSEKRGRKGEDQGEGWKHVKRKSRVGQRGRKQ